MDRWREADDLFQRALELPAADRQGFLAVACRDDPELRTTLEGLLADAEEAGSFLEAPLEECCELPWPEILVPSGRSSGARRDAASDSSAPGRGAAPDGARGGGGRRPAGGQPADRSGERVGPYRLLRRIGRGGMASVYLAERADGLWEQRVAVKLLRRGLATDDLVRRLIGERQILSSLAHPHIARLLDGGATEDGLPYLVMEHVQGTPIVAYCDGRRLPVEERLRLFCHVARAVQHAHRFLVVHRDLKPSNILVDDEGGVKLLDFGIAKLLADRGDAEATRVGLRALTPAYASPEQLRGGPITTASDVYQLGLLLCELLTGRLPYTVRALSPARAERVVAEAVPARPGLLVTEESAAARAASREGLARRLDGDLDTIVLQALRKEPEARYGSAEALAEDVERHLAGQPVRARPATLGYRARKFVGRHRAGVAAAAAFGLLLLASALAASLQATRLATERDRALAQEARAERVTAFLEDIFQVADPNEWRGESLTVLELLEAGASRALAELEGTPRTQADVLSVIGSMYTRRGLYDRARPLLGRAVELDRTIAEDPEELVRDLRRLAAATYPDRRGAVRLLEEAVAVAEARLGASDPRLAGALTDLAENLALIPDPGSVERAVAAVERALVILRAQEGDVGPELASALHLSALGRGLERFDRLEEALAIRRSLYGEDHTAVAATLNDMALALEPFDPVAADSLLERAAEINVRIHGPDHAQTLAILNNLAGRYRDRGEYAKAEPLYREILRRRRLAFPEERMIQAYTLHGLGWSLTELGRPTESEPPLREVVEILRAGGCERGGVACHSVYQMGRSTLGRSIARQGRHAEAEPLLRESFAWVATHHPDSHFIPFMLERLIDLYDTWGKPALAAEYRARRSEWEDRLRREPAPGG